MMAPSGLSPARFPDVYYQVQPVIYNVVQEMDDSLMTYPTQESLDMMVDRAHNQVLMMCPEMVDTEESMADADPNVQETQGRFGPGFRTPFRFRRRGFFRDLLTILLLQELFRRRGFR